VTRRKGTEAREAPAPWMKVWTERWLASTAINAMAIEQEGAFWRLLLFAWMDKDFPCSLANDDEELAQLSKLGDRWATLGRRVKAMFDVREDGRLVNATQWEVYQEMRAAHERRVNAGGKGGEKAKRVGPFASADIAGEWFDNEIWAHYPARIGGNSKTDARKAVFARLREGVEPDALRDGLVRYVYFCDRTGKTGTQWVRTAVVFFGPGKHWSERWEIPKDAGRGNGAKVSAGEKQREELARLHTSSEKSTGDGSTIGGPSSPTGSAGRSSRKRRPSTSGPSTSA
jgi:hypothetical protein